MKPNYPFKPAIFLRRYKRFLADLQMANGEVVTVHCPNTGAMTHCMVEGSPCWYSSSDNTKRKYAHTLELITTSTGHLACINSTRANVLVKEAIEQHVIKELTNYDSIRAEVKYGDENSRIDFLLSGPNKADCYVEVKSVTLGLSCGQGLFPDAPSKRGTKHLRELIEMVKQQHRAVLLFCIQHEGINRFSVAKQIDPDYSQTLTEAINAGVEVLAYKAEISSAELTLVSSLECIF
jgi:sugar fermentation stimulation protein A